MRQVHDCIDTVREKNTIVGLPWVHLRFMFLQNLSAVLVFESIINGKSCQSIEIADEENCAITAVEGATSENSAEPAENIPAGATRVLLLTYFLSMMDSNM